MSRQNDNQPMKHFVAPLMPSGAQIIINLKVLHQNIDQASPDSIGTIWIDNINILSSAWFLSIMEIWWTSLSGKFDTNTKVALWQLQKFYCPSIINEYFSKMENWKNILNISNIWGNQTNLFLIHRLKISIENETDWYCHNLYFLIKITLKTILLKNTFQTIVKYQ